MEDPHPDALVRALIQGVQLPLCALLVVTSILMARRMAPGRERQALLWYAGGFVFAGLGRNCELFNGGSSVALHILEGGVLPALSYACFLAGLATWWRQRPHAG